MKKIVLCFLTFFVISCKKDILLPSPYDATRIEGAKWIPLSPPTPTQEYSFQDGILSQSLLPDYTKVFEGPYAIRKDTMFIGGNSVNPERVWILYFHCDSIVRVKNTGAILNQIFYLKKI